MSTNNTKRRKFKKRVRIILGPKWQLLSREQSESRMRGHAARDLTFTPITTSVHDWLKDSADERRFVQLLPHPVRNTPRDPLLQHGGKRLLFLGAPDATNWVHDALRNLPPVALRNIDDAERRAWLDGTWDVMPEETLRPVPNPPPSLDFAKLEAAIDDLMTRAPADALLPQRGILPDPFGTPSRPKQPVRIRDYHVQAAVAHRMEAEMLEAMRKEWTRLGYTEIEPGHFKHPNGGEVWIER